MYKGPHLPCIPFDYTVEIRAVKQEIFMSDVTICFNALKKVVDEFKSSGNLQMAQPSTRYDYLHLRTLLILNGVTIRPSAVTLADDLRTAFAMEFDNMIAVLMFRDCYYMRSMS